MSEQEEDERALQAEGDEATARHRSASKNRTGAVVLGGVAWVATMAAAVLATLFFAQRGGDVQSLSGSNDQLRDQVTYCASIPNPKADARCKEPVAPPAKEIIEGPRGLQGIPGLQGLPGPQGIQGPPGPQGVRGVQGIPGNSPACLLLANRCVGLPGQDGKNGIDGKPGADGIDGKDGKDGKDGINGKDGSDGVDGKDGAPGATGAKGDTGVGFLGLRCDDVDEDPIVEDFRWIVLYTDGKETETATRCQPA